MHPFVAYIVLARIVGMHDDAVGTAINLRGADFDEIEQSSVQAARIDIIVLLCHLVWRAPEARIGLRL
jgi:hypothetical protein